jgi:hypothetical protein
MTQWLIGSRLQGEVHASACLRSSLGLAASSLFFPHGRRPGSRCCAVGLEKSIEKRQDAAGGLRRPRACPRPGWPVKETTRAGCGDCRPSQRRFFAGNVGAVDFGGGR